jgi:hypothetical protein
VRLGDFKEDSGPTRKEVPSKQSLPDKKALEEAMYALHKAYMAVDTLLRNMPDKKEN